MEDKIAEYMYYLSYGGLGLSLLALGLSSYALYKTIKLKKLKKESLNTLNDIKREANDLEKTLSDI